MQWDPYWAIPLMDKNPSITTWDVQKTLGKSKDYQAEIWFPGFCPLAAYHMSICISKKSVCFCWSSNHPEQVQSSSAIPRMLNIWPQIPRFSGCAGCKQIQRPKWWPLAKIQLILQWQDNNSIVCKSYTDSYESIWSDMYITWLKYSDRVLECNDIKKWMAISYRGNLPRHLHSGKKPNHSLTNSGSFEMETCLNFGSHANVWCS